MTYYRIRPLSESPHSSILRRTYIPIIYIIYYAVGFYKSSTQHHNTINPLPYIPSSFNPSTPYSIHIPYPILPYTPEILNRFLDLVHSGPAPPPAGSPPYFPRRTNGCRVSPPSGLSLSTSSFSSPPVSLLFSPLVSLVLPISLLFSFIYTRRISLPPGTFFGVRSRLGSGASRLSLAAGTTSVSSSPYHHRLFPLPSPVSLPPSFHHPSSFLSVRLRRWLLYHHQYLSTPPFLLPTSLRLPPLSPRRSASIRSLRSP